MGFLATAAPVIGGLLGSAFGGSGRQGGQQQQTTGQQTGATRGATRGGSRNVVEQFEDPLLAPFREQFLGGLGEELERVQEPIFGEGQQAGFLNQLNDLTQNAQSAITNRFAATGGARSGTAEDQLTQSELFRGGQAANFFSQLPFMEEEARRTSTAGLLGQGLNFVGRGPMNQVQTGEADQTSEQLFDRTSEQFMDQDVEGPGFWKSLAGAGGELLGGLLGNNPGNPFDVFRNNRRSPDSPSLSEIPLETNRPSSLDLLTQRSFPRFGG